MPVCCTLLSLSVAEGWLKEDFELTLDTEGQAPRLLTFFGLATGNTLYASLPALSSGAIFPPTDTKRCSSQERSSGCCSSCGCTRDSRGRGSVQETNQRASTCLSCCMQSLPRLCAERGLLLGSDEPGSPWNLLPLEEGNNAAKAKGLSPSHQPSQQSGASLGAEKRRPEAQQTIDVRFDSPAPPVSSWAVPDASSLGISECAERGEKPSPENTQRQSARNNPPAARDEKPKADLGLVLQECDVIVENETTRTIVVGGAWTPGRQGVPPYATVKGDVSGSFEITIDSSMYSHMFTLEPSKGTLSAGSRQMIRAIFSPQAVTPGELGLATAPLATSSPNLYSNVPPATCN